MKSIVQEASTIAKAIENAWISAGKPREFSVKVFEEAEKNFFGMTTKSAKIALFFDHQERAAQGFKKRTEEPKSEPRKEKEYKKSSFTPKQPQLREDHNETQRSVFDSENAIKKEQFANQSSWTDELVSVAKEWIQSSLDAMQKNNISFTIHPSGYYLRITFDQPILENPEKERQLFRSFSFLLLQTLKKHAKRGLHGFKIVLVRD